MEKWKKQSSKHFWCAKLRMCGNETAKRIVTNFCTSTTSMTLSPLPIFMTIAYWVWAWRPAGVVKFWASPLTCVARRPYNILVGVCDISRSLIISYHIIHIFVKRHRQSYRGAGIVLQVCLAVEIFIHGAVKATVTNAPQSQLNKGVFSSFLNWPTVVSH